jgi:hypothetical protein
MENLIDENFTDVEGISALLQRAPSTIYKWKKTGFIPFHQTQPKAPLLFDIKIVEVWWRSLHTTGKRKLS